MTPRNVLIVMVLATVLFLTGSALIFAIDRPATASSLPDRLTLGEDIPLEIHLDGWNPNYHVSQVRFYVDYWKTTAHGPKGSVPMALPLQEGRWEWMRGEVSRIPRPINITRRFTLPAADWAKQGLLQQGVIVGKVDISVSWPIVHGRNASWRGRYMGTGRQYSHPFKIQVSR